VIAAEQVLDVVDDVLAPREAPDLGRVHGRELPMADRQHDGVEPVLLSRELRDTPFLLNLPTPPRTM